VTDAKRVVQAFLAARETGESVLLTQRRHARAPSGQNLVRVGLVTHVPHQAIIRCVEHIVQGDGEFDGTETGGQVSAGLAHGLDEKMAQLVREPRQVGFIEAAQVVRQVTWSSRAVSRGMRINGSGPE